MRWNFVAGSAEELQAASASGNATQALGSVGDPNDKLAAGLGQAWEESAAAMDDDLATPRALAVLHNTVHTGNAEHKSRRPTWSGTSCGPPSSTASHCSCCSL